MKSSTKRTVSAGASVAAIGAIVLGAFTFASSVSATPAPESTPTPAAVYVGFDENGAAAEQEAEAAALVEAQRIEAERVAAEAAAAEAARVEAERIAAEEAARYAERSEGGSSAAPPAPQAPAPAPVVKCPSGTVPTAVDGAGNESGCITGDYTGGVVVP